MTFDIEHTDTFGGDANYSWVRRAKLEAAKDISETALIRRAKALIGTSGQRHTKASHGDLIVLDYPGQCVRTFIAVDY